MNEAIGETDLEKALAKNWSISDHTVVLSGTVDSSYQKDEAGHIAWKAPGVWDVENKLVIEYRYD